jgi:hypothetical protein
MLEEWPLDDRYRIELLAETDLADDADVIEFWAQENAVSAAEAPVRVREVLLVAVEGTDGVVGASSVYLQHHPRLELPMWFQRGFVAARHRASSIGMHFAILGIEHLEREFAAGRDTRGRGVIQEIENEGLKRYFNRGWEPPTNMVFIGENPRGDHVRVHWFPGAHAPRRAER